MRLIRAATPLFLASLLLASPGVAATAAGERPLPRNLPSKTVTAPGIEPAAAPLPACRYQDTKTRYRRLADWRRTLLDTNLKVGRKYRPTDLVSTSRAGVSGGGTVRAHVIGDLMAMARAARSAGKPFKVRSAYRSYQYQVNTFDSWVNQLGLIEARKVSARPGHSEHQLGTTLDFQSAGTSRAPWDYPDWARTSAGRWLKKHAWKYGFIMSYPRGKAAEVCYSYEPWHYRYIGRAKARKVHESGKTLRKYLWKRSESR